MQGRDRVSASVAAASFSWTRNLVNGEGSSEPREAISLVLDSRKPVKGALRKAMVNRVRALRRSEICTTHHHREE